MKLAMEEIRRRFRERGLKLTPQRAAIYRALAETTAHPAAEDLYRRVRVLHPMISQNTVYYTLGALKAAGLVHEVNYWHDRARFDANMAPHHHLICLGCRKIEDLSDDGLNRLTLAKRRSAGFEVIGHRVEFHGFCAGCRSKAVAGKTARRGAGGNHLTIIQRRRDHGRKEPTGNEEPR